MSREVWQPAGVASATIVVLVLLAPPPAFAQGTAASIIGQVTDEGGGVLPGVTVTATSPALQVPNVVSLTDGQGEYRLAPLPIGTYVIQYELQGFQAVRRENIRLTVGFAAKIDVSLMPTLWTTLRIRDGSSRCISEARRSTALRCGPGSRVSDRQTKGGSCDC